MHNRLYSYLINEKIYLKQLRLSIYKGHSTEHAIVHLADQIHEPLENGNYTFRVFIDLSKAFETIDYAIVLQKLENYEIRGTNFASFRSYLISKKQYIPIAIDSKSDLRNTTCGVPQGSHLGPLSFVVCANDLLSSSKKLNLIMFATI